MKTATIFIIDDDPAICFAFQRAFPAPRFETIAISTAKEALKQLEKQIPSVIFMDIMMPDMDGLHLLQIVKQKWPEIPVIIITGYGTMHTALQAIKLGAYEYLTKPLDVEKVRLLVDRALEMVQLRQALKNIPIQYTGDSQGYELIGRCEKMQDVFKKMGAAAATPNSTTILIQGESGTGKELVARAIHQNSQFPMEPFVPINCTALPENLFESELFGHEKGAFTGAHERKPGLMERAGRGTIFLDEIGDLSPYLQQKLLRVIQEREFFRVGGTEPIPLEARIIAATHHHLEKEVQEGKFREDLYYRLNVMVIQLPPLRERREDIPLLAQYFLARSNAKLKKSIKIIAPEVMRFLMQYDFPGNVRELENMIERAVILEKGDSLSKESFKDFLQHSSEFHFPHSFPTLNYQQARKQWLQQFEKLYLVKLLQRHKGNVTHAAQEAGISRQTLQKMMKKHGFHAHDFREGSS